MYANAELRAYMHSLSTRYSSKLYRLMQVEFQLAAARGHALTDAEEDAIRAGYKAQHAIAKAREIALHLQANPHLLFQDVVHTVQAVQQVVPSAPPIAEDQGKEVLP